MNRPAAPSAFHAGIAWLAAPVAAGVAFSLYLIIHAHRANHGIDCFPLDDPWIHLTYARNLAFHHSFSYFPGDHPTAGSTSPLYTLLLALGFHVTRNEKLLSWVLGILFQAGFLVMAALWARKRLGSSLLAAAFVLVLGLDARLAILSVSGMETSLFLFLMAAAFWAWAESRAVWLGLALGLGVWTRPESLILAGVLVLVTLLGRTRSRRAGEKSQPRVMRWAIPFAALVLLYFVFNRLTGGTFFPNTMAAKHAAYQQSRWFFMTHGVREALLSSAFVVLTPLALIQIGAEGARALRRKRSNLLAEAGWVPALVLAYVVFLPYAHRFSRYLVPALPAIALLGLAALQGIGARLSARRV
ncbi:MAG TPA: hypothetical protein VFH88_11360, partial [Candidatus Krumholzibacteria bacterium]|nr:hypothetical protein [Candidatus Krumholzibacteria bacterium]